MREPKWIKISYPSGYIPRDSDPAYFATFGAIWLFKDFDGCITSTRSASADEFMRNLREKREAEDAS